MWSPGLKCLFELLHIVTGGKKSNTSLKWIWNSPRSDDFFAPSYLAPELQTADTFQTRHAALCNSSCGFGTGPDKISFLDPGSEWRGVAPGLLFLNLLVRRDRDQSGFHVQQLHPDDVPRTQRRPCIFIIIIFFNSAALNGRRKWRQKDEKRAGLLSVHLESCCCLGRRLSCALWIQGLSSKPIGESIINRLKIALRWPPAAAGHLNLLPAAVLADETATSAWRCAATEGSRAPCFI